MNELVERDVLVGTGEQALPATLTLVPNPLGLVVFVHGSGSSRQSPRNRFVAHALAEHGMATLLTDLLLPDEEAFDRHTARLRFDIGFLAKRVGVIVDWCARSPDCAGLPLGLFGASTGAAAALVAAARYPHLVEAVVSRGGRPDLAGATLAGVRAPTLLIVGEKDAEVLRLNRIAASTMEALHAIAVVPQASHLFEEPGALEEVAGLACDWFSLHLHGRGEEPARRAM